MVSDFYHPHVGGVEVVVRNLAHELSGRGHDVSVATIGSADLPPYEDDGPVHVHRIRSSAARFASLFAQHRTWAPPVPDPESVGGLRRIVGLESPEIVHGHDWLARSFLPIPARSRIPFVLSLHYYTVTCAKKTLVYGGAPCSGPGLVKCIACGSRHYGSGKGTGVVLGNFVFAEAERRAVDLFIPVSEATAVGNRLVGSGLPYMVIPNFVRDPKPWDPREVDRPERLPEGDFLLFVGDLRSEKGIEILFDAYRALDDPPPLVLIGKVWPDSPHNLPENVHLLTGWLNEHVREAQRRCLALVAPSVWPEPFGMVVLETLAAGRPVIASRIAGLAELVEDRVNGLLVQPGDAGALRKAMASVVNDAVLVNSLAANASPSAERFHASRIVPRFERAYAHVLESLAPGPQVPRRAR
jgi:glycosyltransferase involved in cell wall biosynthesis